MVERYTEEEILELIDEEGNLTLLPPGYIIKVSKNLKPYISRLPGAPLLPEGKVIKISKNLKPFISKVTIGETQRLFAEIYGKEVGDCVKNKVVKGMTGAEIHQIARECSEKVKGRKLRG